MAGRYKIFEELGVGGAGKVYKAYDTQLDRYVAIKRLLTREEADREDSQSASMRKEAGSLATLQHPNIVTIYDLGGDEEGTFIVMELLDGDTLADWIRGSTLSLGDFYELATQTLEGVLTAHSQSILHRDLKPENIKVKRMAGGRLQAKIVDFGLARLSYGAKKQTEDQKGNVLGSIYYMAPEQFQRRPLDGRTDLYSLGCLYYQALCGQRPFQHDSMAGVMQLHLDHNVTLLHDLRPDLPQQLCDWVMWLMNKDPQDRPANAQQALDTLRALHAAGQFAEHVTSSVPARPISTTVRPVTTGIAHVPTGSVSQRITATQRGASGSVPRPISTSIQRPQAAAPQYEYAQIVADDDAVPVILEPEPKRAIPVWAWIAGASVIVLLGGWLLLRKPAPPPAQGSTAQTPTPAAPAPAVPTAMPANLLTNGFIVRWSAAEKTEAWSDSGKKEKPQVGDLVASCFDLAPAAGDGLLTVWAHKRESCPKLALEKAGGPLKVPLSVLRFESGQGMYHRMESNLTDYKNYPFSPYVQTKGLTFMMLFRPRILQNEIRVVRLHAQGVDDIVDVFASPASEFKIRARAGGKTTEAKITMRNTAIFSLITVMVDGQTNKLLLNVRGADGGKGRAETDAPPGFHVMNDVRFSEFSTDPAHPVGEADKIAGDLAEVVMWPFPMEWDSRSQMEQKIVEHYFTNPGSRFN